MSWSGPDWVQLFGTLCASCILISVSFRFGKFSDIISSNIFSIPFYFSFPSGIPIMHRLACFMLSHRSVILFPCFFIWFSVACPDWVISIILTSTSLIHSSALFILFFIAFSSVCISASEFSIFSWLLLKCSSFFLGNLHTVHIFS